MMTPFERAETLRSQADALESLAELEAANLAAKEAYAQDMTPENQEAKHKAAEALNSARSAYRSGTQITGDAFRDDNGGSR